MTRLKRPLLVEDGPVAFGVVLRAVRQIARLDGMRVSAAYFGVARVTPMKAIAVSASATMAIRRQFLAMLAKS